MFKWLSKPQKNKKVYVGVSGGVDSSVTAALLQDQGYDVVGVFIRTWQPDFIECTWRDERRDAMRVCAHLGIPFVELNLEQEYKDGVADYMIAEYKLGRTPNPDVMCNREVKFGGFLKWALAHGADYIATGHYAQVRVAPLRRGAVEQGETEGYELVRGIDQSKDQSYFLWTLTQDQLKHVLFPVGHLPKNKVRVLAQKYQLPTAVKKDSQGICFIGEIDMKDFLKRYIAMDKGSVVNEQGKTIGNHEGVLLYTLGERHGFQITEKGIDDKPYYVVAKNIKENTITVSQDPQLYGSSHQVIITDCIWRGSPSFRGGDGVFAQIRYHGALKKITVKVLTHNEVEIVFDEPDFSLAPGQSVVVFNGDTCIGGGIVK